MAGTKTWLVMTVDDLKPYCVQDQLNILQTNATDPDKAAFFAALMPDVASEVRTAIASNPANTLSATANSVPPELKRTTIWLLMEAMQQQFSNATGLTPSQMEQVKEAKLTLDRVRNWKLGGGFYISAPDDPETARSQSIRPTAAAVSTNANGVLTERLYTRETLIGL